LVGTNGQQRLNPKQVDRFVDQLLCSSQAVLQVADAVLQLLKLERDLGFHYGKLFCVVLSAGFAITVAVKLPTKACDSSFLFLDVTEQWV